MVLLDESASSGPVQSEDPNQGTQEFNKKTPVFKKKSDQFPDLNTNPQIAAFLLATIREIKNMPSILLPSNLSKQQLNALKNLQAREDTIIKASDKGGNIVLQTCQQ